MKTRFKRNILLAFLSAIVTPVPVILACVLTKTNNENNSQWFKIFSEIKNEANTKISYVFANNHKLNYLIDKAKQIDNFIKILNLNENSGNNWLIYGFSKIWKLIQEFDFILKQKTQEYNNWLTKVDDVIKLLKDKKIELLKFKNKNNVNDANLNLIQKRIDEILDNYTKAPNDENIDDIKIRYQKIVESCNYNYQKSIKEETNKTKKIKEEIKNLKKDYFNKIENGKEYYKLYDEEIAKLLYEANQLNDNIHSILDHILNRKSLENKFNDLKKEVEEHKKISKYIKENANKNNENFWGTWRENILGKYFVYQNFMDNTNVAIWYGLALKIENLSKQNFINNKVNELKQLLEKWKLYGQALIRDTFDAIGISGLFFTVNTKVRMLENYSPLIDPNRPSKKGEYYILIEKLKNLLNEIQERSRKASKNLQNIYDQVVKDDVEKILEYVKANGYGFSPQEAFNELMTWSNYYLNQMPEIFQHYKEKIIKPVLDQIKTKGNSASDVVKLEELYNYKYNYTNFYEPYNFERDSFYWEKDYKNNDKNEKIKDDEGRYILKKQIPHHLKNEYDTARLFLKIERTIDEVCKKYSITNPLN
ncbi:putative lipoprotein [Ureaplasma urealyticum serovar 10 str. ATCC 33699]|uniref:Putative lipoprotein n=1 Tax=Ureaplasma urealyticum serovar 10 (strain ATCC 33699 / Western) TaxID=565575 RepID=B5ZB73_UREU1|nr:hypothetical protein [Ureaplasma urealyticum]ACI59782.1 putative lipoprotein [Ureaplasma urealyticum serovar 10 str. ATCC 33699]